MDAPRTSRPSPTILTPSDLAARLKALEPSPGGVRLVALDGHAGSGKSVLARLLARELGGAPVIRLDDIASHDCLFDWAERVREELLLPLARGEAARHRVYDWRRRRFTTETAIPPAEVVLLDGVGSGRRALRPCLACLIWMAVPEQTAWARGRARDGAEQREFWQGWMKAERSHFAGDPSQPHADILLTPEHEGYVAEFPGRSGIRGGGSDDEGEARTRE